MDGLIEFIYKKTRQQLFDYVDATIEDEWMLDYCEKRVLFGYFHDISESERTRRINWIQYNSQWVDLEGKLTRYMQELEDANEKGD